MEGKSSIQNAEIEHFFFTFLPVDNIQWVKVSDVLTVKFFFHQIIANLQNNAPDIVRSQNVRNLGFFKIMLVFFFKIVKGGKFAVECVSNDAISFNSFFYLSWFFGRWFSNLEKLSKFAEDSIFSRKRFHPSKRYLLQNQRAKICRWWPAV